MTEIDKIRQLARKLHEYHMEYEQRDNIRFTNLGVSSANVFRFHSGGSWSIRVNSIVDEGYCDIDDSGRIALTIVKGYKSAVNKAIATLEGATQEVEKAIEKCNKAEIDKKKVERRKKLEAELAELNA